MKNSSFNFKKVVTTLGFAILLMAAINSGFLSSRAGAQTDQTQVLYFGDTGEQVFLGLSLDKENLAIMQLPRTAALPSLVGYDVVILNDANLTLVEIDTLYSWAEIEGHGLIIIMGPTLNEASNILSRFRFTDTTEFENNTGDYGDDNNVFNARKGISVVSEEEELQSHPILDTVVWNTAPETFHMSLIPDLKNDVTTYVRMQWNNESRNEMEEPDFPMIAGRSVGVSDHNNVFVFAGWFQLEFETTKANEHVTVWPYFNYMMFATVQSSTGLGPADIPEYGKWDYSPVPHKTDQIILGVVIGVISVGSIILFVVMRKKRHNPVNYFETEGLATFQAPGEEGDGESEATSVIDKENKWEKIGFHRQLSGFLKLYFLMMLLIIPQLLISSMIMPQFIQPYAQASGWYSYTLHAFEAIWLLFDLGFNYAITKYFAQHRIERPQKAYHYVQIFIWWEILSGVLQVTIVAVFGAIILPNSNFNYLSWMFVVHSLIQFPGIFLVFQYIFQGMQRSDFQMISFALQAFVLRLGLQVGTVPLFKWIFANNPMYGPAFGAAIGLLVGQLLGDWGLYFITWKMYRSLKLKSNPIFRADFTREEFKETLKFGLKMALGEMWVPLVWFVQVYLVVEYLPNSSQEQGYFELAYTIAQVPMALALLTTGLLGGITEAHTYKKKNLLNYNTVSGFKWGNTWTYYLVGVFLAIGETFVIGASGPLWIKAAKLLPLFMIARVLGPITWMSDQEFAGAGKPIYAGIAWLLENIIKAGLMWAFIVYFKSMESILWAYIISLAIKDTYVLITMRRKIHKWPWSIYITYIAPAISGGLIYLLFRGFDILITGFLGQGIISAMLLLVIALFIGEFIHSFIYAFLGGYDDNTIKELDDSTQMVTGVKGLARLYYKCAAAGCKVSPLHNKFKIKIYEAAAREAEELTAIKKRIA